MFRSNWDIWRSKTRLISKRANIKNSWYSYSHYLKNILIFLIFYLPFFVSVEGVDFLEDNKRDYLGMVRIFLSESFFFYFEWYLLSICKSILIFLSSYLLSFLGGKAGWVFLEHNKWFFGDGKDLFGVDFWEVLTVNL